MKICHIAPLTADLSGYFALCRPTYSLCRSNTQVIDKAIKRGTNSISDLGYWYTWFLSTRELVESVIEAEKEGYDAAVISAFIDPGVKEARSVVNIPVFGVGEVSMMYATLLGSRFGIVTGRIPLVVEQITLQIRERGLESRAISYHPVRPHPLSEREMFTAIQEQNPRLIADGVEKVGRELIKDGADVVICGVTAMAPSCTAAGLVKFEPEGIPLLNCLAITLKIAEVMVDLKDKIGLPFISRASIYELPSEEDTKRVRALFGLGTS